MPRPGHAAWALPLLSPLLDTIEERRAGGRPTMAARSVPRLVLDEAVEVLGRVARQTRDGQPWPSLARLDRTSRLPRRSVIRILCEFKERGFIATRPRDFAAGKAGAT